MLNFIAEMAFGVTLVVASTSIIFLSSPGSCEEVADGRPSVDVGLLEEEMPALSRQPRSYYTECCDGAQAKGCRGCRDVANYVQLDCRNIDFFPTCSDTENVSLSADSVNVTEIPAGALDDFNYDSMSIYTAMGVDVKLADKLFTRRLGTRLFTFLYGGPGDFPGHAFDFSSRYVGDNSALDLGYVSYTLSGTIPCGMFHDAYELKSMVTIYRVKGVSENLFPNNRVPVRLRIVYSPELVLGSAAYDMAFRNTHIYQIEGVVCCGFAEAALAEFPHPGLSITDCTPDTDQRCVDATLAPCQLPTPSIPPAIPPTIPPTTPPQEPGSTSASTPSSSLN